MSSYAISHLQKIHRPCMKHSALADLLAQKGFKPTAVSKTEKQVRRFYGEPALRFVERAASIWNAEQAEAQRLKEQAAMLAKQIVVAKKQAEDLRVIPDDVAAEIDAAVKESVPAPMNPTIEQVAALTEQVSLLSTKIDALHALTSKLVADLGGLSSVEVAE